MVLLLLRPTTFSSSRAASIWERRRVTRQPPTAGSSPTQLSCSLNAALLLVPPPPANPPKMSNKEGEQPAPLKDRGSKQRGNKTSPISVLEKEINHFFYISRFPEKRKKSEEADDVKKGDKKRTEKEAEAEADFGNALRTQTAPPLTCQDSPRSSSSSPSSGGVSRGQVAAFSFGLSGEADAHSAEKEVRSFPPTNTRHFNCLPVAVCLPITTATPSPR